MKGNLRLNNYVVELVLDSSEQLLLLEELQFTVTHKIGVASVL